MRNARQKELARRPVAARAGQADFLNFIKPDRDNLQKEFRGFHPSFSSPAIVADPSMHEGLTSYVGFEPEALLTTDGRRAVPLMKEAVAFWNSRLDQAEVALKNVWIVSVLSSQRYGKAT